MDLDKYAFGQERSREKLQMDSSRSKNKPTKVDENHQEITLSFDLLLAELFDEMLGLSFTKTNTTQRLQ